MVILWTVSPLHLNNVGMYLVVSAIMVIATLCVWRRAATRVSKYTRFNLFANDCRLLYSFVFLEGKVRAAPCISSVATVGHLN